MQCDWVQSSAVRDGVVWSGAVLCVAMVVQCGAVLMVLY